jgi:hypothetical protein
MMFTFREIFYNQKIRGCFATAIRGRAREKMCSATLNPGQVRQIGAAQPLSSR